VRPVSGIGAGKLLLWKRCRTNWLMQYPMF